MELLNKRFLLLFCINFYFFFFFFPTYQSAIIPTITSGIGNETDRLALLAFKDEITKDPFGALSSWNDSFHFCTWSGVTCSRRHPSRVTVLDLRDKSLIPINLANCSQLTVLLVAVNQLVGRIPTELGSLSKLLRLVLDQNQLTGTIPVSLSNLSSLDRLSFGRNNLIAQFFNISSIDYFVVAGNQFHGTIPPDIGLTLPNLQYLGLYSNRFSGTLPISIANASGLVALDFGKNQFTGLITPSLGTLKGLNFLNLQSNQLGVGEIDDLTFLDSLTNCSDLEVLGLNNNNLMGRLPDSVANLSAKLSSFFIGENQISGKIPIGMENLVSLASLRMEFNLLTGSIPVSIGKLSNLQEVHMHGNQLSGQIPSNICNNTQLAEIIFDNNRLQGRIPPSLGNCGELQILSFSQNQFVGTIPKSIMGLSNLSIYNLDLSQNLITGNLPSEVGNLKNLLYLSLSDNKLSGGIPSSLENCLGLNRLFLDGNLFEGIIPPSLKSLKGVQELDLSRNNLSGRIPEYLQSFDFLKNLNLSFNDLEGEVPKVGIFRNLSAFSILGNDKLCGGIGELHLPSCPNPDPEKHRKQFPLKRVILIIGAVTCSILLGLFVIFFWKRRARKTSSSSASPLGDKFQKVSYKELLKATDGFSSDNLIGVGSYGSVYKGRLGQETTTSVVAVKVLDLQRRGASKSFTAECEALRCIRHRNLVKVLTSCSSVDFKGNEFKALVFEFMPNGSLDNWLHPTSTSNDQFQRRRCLSFMERLNVVIDVAYALEYLHHRCHTPIVHCDLKPSNVLLDDGMNGHVGDFGLAKFLSGVINVKSENHTSSVGIRGSVGYAAPEYGMGGEVSKSGDVYSYGILLLEMFTGRRPTDAMFKDDLGLHSFAKSALPDRVMQIIDPTLLHLQNDENHEDDDEALTISNNEEIVAKMFESLISIVRVGVMCSTESPRERLEMVTVVKEVDFVSFIYKSHFLLAYTHTHTKKKKKKTLLVLLASSFISPNPKMIKQVPLISSLILLILNTSFLLCINSQKSMNSPPQSTTLTSDHDEMETDRLALLAFKNQIIQDPLGSLNSWNNINNSFHFCNWQGITCSPKHQRVTELFLQSHAIVGTFSPYIGNLTFLRLINLENNSFYGEIPQEIGRLSRLERLRLSNNSFVGKIPASLSNCSELIDLHLSSNYLTGKLPDELGSLSKLVILSLRSNNLTGSIPPSFGNLSSLQHITLTYNNLEGSIPDSFGLMPSLEFIRIGSNKLSGTVPPSLWNLSSLIEFYVVGNQLHGSLPVDIGFTLPNLQNFGITSNNFYGGIPISFSNISRLDYFDIANNNFFGSVPTDLGRLQHLVRLDLSINNLHNLSFLTSLINCTKLEKLILDENRFEGILPNSIANLSTKLHILKLGRNQISGSIPEGIGNLVNLTQLSMGRNLLRGRIPFSIGKLQKLYRLNLNGNKLTEEIPSSLGNITQLFELRLQSNNLIGSIPLSIKNYQRLHKLDLSDNGLNGTIPKDILSSSSHLTYLNISHNSLTGSLPLEVGGLGNLQVLDVSYNKMSGEIPTTLGKCLRLEELYMEGNIFQGNISSFLYKLEGIQYLDLSSNNLSGEIPKKVENFPLLRTSNFSFNNFHGELPMRGVFSNASAISIIGNDKLCGENLIGSGSFGSVYKGILGEDEIPVAVKVINLQQKGAAKSFMAECEALGKVRHRNLIKILTTCSSIDSKGNEFKALVFKFISNGSLENWFHPNVDEEDGQKQLKINFLSFSQRLNIAIDVASALDYLHHQCPPPIVHCDLKPSNVLLDEQFTAHVADFGLAKFLSKAPNNSVKCGTSSVTIKGSIGYIAPEYGMGGAASTNGDVYSYGILLLEMFTGKRPVDEMFKDGLNLHDYAKNMALMEVVDQRLLQLLEEEDHHQEQHDVEETMRLVECLVSVIRIGVACSMESQVDRMDINDVIMDLHWIRQAYEQDSSFIEEYSQYFFFIFLLMEGPQFRLRVFWSLYINVVLLLCMNLHSESTITTTTITSRNESDRLALLAFKDLITQDPLGVMNSWNDSIHFCEWVGVSCSPKNQRVVILNLASQKLVGSIPPSIGNLTFLTGINLRNNYFHAEIPQELGLLLRLQFLNLTWNSFTGKIPTNLTHCTDLRILDFVYNDMVGYIPDQLSSLTKLYYLGLRGNNFTGRIPPWIGNISSLFAISLAENNLQGEIPEEFGRLSRLGMFEVFDNELSGMIPSSIYNISSIYYITVASNQLHGRLPTDLGFLLPNLRILAGGVNSFTGPIPVSISNISGLEILDFEQNRLTGPVPINLGRLQGLSRLNFGSNYLGSGETSGLNILTSLVNCTALEVLGLDYNNLGGELPESIANLSTQLRILTIGGNAIRGSIPNGIENLVNLTSLGLEGNLFSGSIPVVIGSLQKLQRLHLNGTIPQSLSTLRGIQELDLSRNNLSGQIPDYLEKLSSLKYLNLSFNDLEGEVPKGGVFANTGLFKSTGGFSTDNLIGVGSFGSVYKGVRNEDGAFVAVKVLNLQQLGASKSFIAECEALRNIRHRNLVKVITTCSSVDSEGNDFKAIVFELMPNGSLEQWLHPQVDRENDMFKSLNLIQRLNIAIDVASALEYLHHHCETPIAHCDLKPSNVLINKDMTAHVSDFGLASFLLETSNSSSKNKNISVGLKGSIGYIPPEYGMGGQASIYGDVYSYGILLLEMFTGKRPTDNMFKDGLNLHNFAMMGLPGRVMEIIDPLLLSAVAAVEEEQEVDFARERAETARVMEHRMTNTGIRIRKCLVSVIRIGISCSLSLPSDRMVMKNVGRSSIGPVVVATLSLS
ncbi:Protein kinase domain [Macleaya cordata]|uniref:non-specific serine/threonine protein kinase n=1 Tax=Macleaya cordata TaxID=56857 RepID=A0A200PWW7_MACCD|nr:Protein kinase domain [Macleaya cordata]